MFVIATSSSFECLRYFIFSCHEYLQSLLDIETGYASKLFIHEDIWKTLTEDIKKELISKANSFIDGWNARENLKH